MSACFIGEIMVAVHAGNPAKGFTEGKPDGNRIAACSPLPRRAYRSPHSNTPTRSGSASGHSTSSSSRTWAGSITPSNTSMSDSAAASAVIVCVSIRGTGTMPCRSEATISASIPSGSPETVP
ncbi:hypothetical protein N6H13_24230 [Paenibacillus sp. CC-CFT742]|nr:hypothetical protein [Paenibacillus sp. CC-CFT742]WJH28161.1 hypothetical protein N6H13_24230 [Paenibacillus sp. CC-CFT742]